MKQTEVYNNLWRKWTNITEGPSAKHRIRLILKLINKCKLHGTILDAGCGEGTLLKQLNHKNNILYGMDISKTALENISPPIEENIKFLIGDISKQESLPPMKFDLIICSEVLEHLDDDDTAIKNMNNLLNNSGKLIITVPYKKKYWTLHDDYAGHFRRYEWDELIDKLEQNGFTILKIFSWGWPLFNLYYKIFLKNINPDIIWGEKTKLKSMVSNILYYVFLCDDLFTFLPKGRRLFVLAKKIQ